MCLGPGYVQHTRPSEHAVSELEHMLPTIPERFLCDRDLRKNSLRGTLPTTAFAALTALERLYMDANQLSGYLPSSLSLLTALKSVYVGDNWFSGSLPTFNSQLQHL